MAMIHERQRIVRLHAIFMLTPTEFLIPAVLRLASGDSPARQKYCQVFFTPPSCCFIPVAYATK